MYRQLLSSPIASLWTWLWHQAAAARSTPTTHLLSTLRFAPILSQQISDQDGALDPQDLTGSPDHESCV